jgi:hypothetical protein
MIAWSVDLVGSQGVGRGRLGGGEERVEPPYINQTVMPGRAMGFGVEVGNASHDQPAGHLISFGLSGERGERYLGNLGPRYPLTRGVVEHGVGVLERGTGLVVDAGDRGVHPLVPIRVVTDTCVPPASAPGPGCGRRTPIPSGPAPVVQQQAAGGRP